MLKPYPPIPETRTDSQTGLPNRTAFCEEIRRRLSEAQRHGNRLSLILAKIDNLNDTIRQHSPHDTDLMLRTCAQFFTAAMRDMDLVVRYDADIFGIMLPGTPLQSTTGVGQRLRTTIQKSPLRLRESEIHFTLSAGVAEAQPGEDVTTFLNRVEAATAMAVADGGDSVRFHNGIVVEPIAHKKKNWRLSENLSATRRTLANSGTLSATQEHCPQRPFSNTSVTFPIREFLVPGAGLILIVTLDKHVTSPQSTHTKCG